MQQFHHQPLLCMHVIYHCSSFPKRSLQERPASNASYEKAHRFRCSFDGSACFSDSPQLREIFAAEILDPEYLVKAQDKLLKGLALGLCITHAPLQKQPCGSRLGIETAGDALQDIQTDLGIIAGDCHLSLLLSPDHRPWSQISFSIS